MGERRVTMTATQYHVALVVHFWLGIVVGGAFGYALVVLW